MKDLITIALPVYKRTDYIKSALDSAVNQTRECSILLIDNNSPHDDFKKIIDGYKNPNIRYVKTDETVPQDENFNNCFRYADTPWVTVLHDDDMLHCQYVEFCRKIMDKYGEAVGGIAYTSHVGEEEWEGIYTTKELTDDIRILNPEFFYFNNFAFPGILVNKDVAMELGGFRSELHPIADFDFWYRYSVRKQMLYVNQNMAFYRISPTQSTNHLMDAMINDIYKYRYGLIEDSKHNQLLSKLGLEHSRIHNIRYFENTYDDIELPEIHNYSSMNRAKRLFRYTIPEKIVRRYKNRLSFSTV